MMNGLLLVHGLLRIGDGEVDVRRGMSREFDRLRSPGGALLLPREDTRAPVSWLSREASLSYAKGLPFLRSPVDGPNRTVRGLCVLMLGRFV